MKKFLLIVIVFISFYSCQEKSDKSDSIVYIDDLGNKVELNHYPEKVISTAPNLTEIIFSIGAGNSLVGRTQFCNYPPEVEQVQIIGDMLRFNYEKILELKPDLIFLTVEGNTKESYDKLKTLGLNVYVTNPRDLKSIIHSIKTISEILNKKQIGDSLIQQINFRLNEIKRKNFDRKSAIFVVSLNPLIVAGKNTFINEILESVNLFNIAPESISNYPILSREEVIIKNPDFIILPESKNLSKQYLLKIFPEWKRLSAIKKNQIIFVEPDLFFRPGPRFIQAIEYLASEREKLKKEIRQK